MFMLPSKEEMEEIGISARSQKLLHDFYKKNKDAFERGMMSQFMEGWECYRTGSDGTVEFITRDEFLKMMKDDTEQNDSRG